jgi:glycosyltransferase involved in cell wall biosynthesis
VAGIESSAVRRLFGRLEAAKVEREEQRAWSVADGCVATSSVDEAVIRTARPEMPTAVVPNAVDTDYFHPSPAPADPEGIVFVASLSYRPNTDAVAWFTDQVLPRVRRARPGAVLTVVGKGPPTWLRRLEGPGVVVTGAVDDVRPFLERASVVVAPLRVGSGTRLKVLEGLSMAKAVVSTTLGAEGLDVADGEHLLLADDPAELADTILRVMADPALAGRLGAAGRALVLERYGWASAAARLEAFHAEVAGVEVGGGPWR